MIVTLSQRRWTQCKDGHQYHHAMMIVSVRHHRKQYSLWMFCVVFVLWFISLDLYCNVLTAQAHQIYHHHDCPCSDSKWCAPIRLMNKEPVAAFSNSTTSSVFSQHNDYPMEKKKTKQVIGFTLAADLPVEIISKMSAIITWNDETDKLMCLAHEMGVQLVINARASAVDFQSEAAIETFVTELMERVDKTFADGVNFDYESAMTEKSHVSNYTKLVQETYQRMKQKNPFSHVSGS